MTGRTRRWLLATALLVLGAGLAGCELPTPLGTVRIYVASPSRPSGPVVTADGSVWFANLGNASLGRRSPDGTIATIPSPGCRPQALTVGADGDVWFPCSNTDRIARVSASGTISTAPAGVANAYDITTAPDGALWYVGSGSDGIARRTPAGAVSVFPTPDWPSTTPVSITIGPDGNLWITTQPGWRYGGEPKIVRLTAAGVATTFTAPGLLPGDITTGPDGNLWFTNFDGIGRISTSGTITIFRDPAIVSPNRLAAGTDGNLWFVGTDRAVGRITTAGVATRFPDPGIVAPTGITPSTNGLWFTDATSTSGGVIGHITTAGAVTSDVGGANRPSTITKGLDGSVWFANFGREETGGGIGRIAPDGTTQVFHDAGVVVPQGIAPGPDGDAWFTNELADTIGRVTPEGAFTFYSHPSIDGPRGITLGTDGNLWFTNLATGSIGRITPSGAVTAYPGGGITQPIDITTASDGGMWFRGATGATIGRVDTTGAVRTFVLPHPPSAISAVGPDLWFTVSSHDLIGAVTPDGVITTDTDPLVDAPYALVADASGNVYFGNGVGFGAGAVPGPSIGRRSPDGTFTTYPLDPFYAPWDMVGGFGDVWLASGEANAVVRFGTAG